MSDPDLDAFGLLASRRRFSARFGEIDAAVGLVRANMTSSMNELPDAELVLDLQRVPPVDYFSELELSAIDGDREIPRFAGSVLNAVPSADGVVVTALGAVSLVERTTGAIASRVSPAELLHLVARVGGLREDKIRVQGIDQLPLELFEIVAPIDGVVISQPVDFAGVRFLPAAVGLRVLGGLEVEDDLLAQFSAPAFALAFSTSRRTLDAESIGLATIDRALAWMTVRLRYGLAELPDGTALRFERNESLTRVSRRRVVAVRGLSTTRQWLRTTDGTERERTIALESTPRLKPTMPALTLQEEQALLSLKRATEESDLLARVQALWEAIEFYASGAKVPKVFTAEELKAIIEALPTELSDEQRDRVRDRIGAFNDPPLMARLRSLLDTDEVPIHSSELDLLTKLRTTRNDVVHGRKAELPVAEDLEYATSIVARMLVFRIDRLTASELSRAD